MLRKLSIITGFGLLIACSLLLPSYINNPEKGVYLDRAQGQKAFVLLNKIRKDPNAYSERYGVSLRNIPPRMPLVWDDSLAAIAEHKALSMAMGGYYGHVDPQGNGINYYINKVDSIPADWVLDKKASTLDALEGGAPSGEMAIKNIVTDQAKTNNEGRKVILCEGDFNSALTDVGIAYVHGTGSTKYWSYTVVICAPHCRRVKRLK